MTIIVRGFLDALLVTRGYIGGGAPPAPTPFHAYIDPRGTILAGAAFLPRETTLAHYGDPFRVDPRKTRIADPS